MSNGLLKNGSKEVVLILILLEDTLWEFKDKGITVNNMS